MAASKKGGKETNHDRIVLSADGKTRTVTLSATDASGAKITSTAIYEKNSATKEVRTGREKFEGEQREAGGRRRFA